VLLVLQWDEIVEPFNNEETEEKREEAATGVQAWPVNHVEDGGFPIVVFAQVQAVGLEASETVELRGDMVRDGSGVDGEWYPASGEDRGRAKYRSRGIKVSQGDDVTSLVELGCPTEWATGILCILVTFDVDEGWQSGKGSEGQENLKLDVGFREQRSAGGNVRDVEGSGEATNQTFAVGVDG
jgi:hypothetical protein